MNKNSRRVEEDLQHRSSAKISAISRLFGDEMWADLVRGAPIG